MSLGRRSDAKITRADMPGVTYCCVMGCTNNTRQQKQLVFFRIPTSLTRMHAWTNAIKRVDIQSKKNPGTYRVCAVHFSNRMFVNKRLKNDAIPTLCLPGSSNRKVAEPSTTEDGIDLPPITPDQQQQTLILPERFENSAPFKFSSTLVYEGDDFFFQPLHAAPRSTASATVSNLDATPALQKEDTSEKTCDSETGQLPKEENIFIDARGNYTLPKRDVFPASSKSEDDLIEEEEDFAIDTYNSHSDPSKRESNIVTIKTERQDDIEIICISESSSSSSYDKNTTLDSVYTVTPNSKDCQKVESSTLKESSLQVSTNSQSINDKCNANIEKNGPSSVTIKEIDKLTLSKQTEILTRETTTLKRKNEENAQMGESSQDEKKCKTNDDNFTDQLIIWKKKIHSLYKGKSKTLEYRLFGLNLYMNCPQIYDFLQKTMSLPDLSTIEEIEMYFKSGVSDDIITLLSKRIDCTSPHYKYCMITMTDIELKGNLSYHVPDDEIIGFTEIDGIKMKEIARNALLLSVKGCIDNYNETLGYAFTGNENKFEALSKWLFKTIRQLSNAGFVVCAVVSHQRYNDFAKSIGVNKEKPFFEIDDAKVFYVFDAPHLIKEVRQHLFKCNFTFDGSKLASWKHIKAFHDVDKVRVIKMAPKLTDLHLNPIKGKKLYHGKQLLSYSVAAGMSVAIEMGHLPPKAQDTADFILKVDQLSDILNSDGEVNSNKFKRAFCGDKFQVECLNESLKTFKSIKAFNVDTNECVISAIKTFTCIQVTINAILQLHDYFKEHNVKSISTKMFTLDANECVLKLREARKNEDMTAKLFKSQFSYLMFQNIKRKRNDSRIDLDLQTFLDPAYDFNTKLFFEREVLLPFNPLIVPDKQLIQTLPKRSAWKRACVELLKVCLQIHPCVTLVKHMKSNDKNGAASEEFVKYVFVFEGVFVKYFQVAMMHSRVGHKLLNMLLPSTKLYKKPCPCFPTEPFLMIFLRMRIDYVVKINNKVIKSIAEGEKRFEDDIAGGLSWFLGVSY